MEPCLCCLKVALTDSFHQSMWCIWTPSFFVSSQVNRQIVDCEKLFILIWQKMACINFSMSAVVFSVNVDWITLSVLEIYTEIKICFLLFIYAQWCEWVIFCLHISLDLWIILLVVWWIWSPCTRMWALIERPYFSHNGTVLLYCILRLHNVTSLWTTVICGYFSPEWSAECFILQWF